MYPPRFALSAALVLLLASLTATAGDFAALKFIGFSKDGRYLAFEEYGTQDGSGYPYSNIYFVDVAKNAFAVKGIYTRFENEFATEAQARRKSKLAAAASMRKLRIVAGNIGTMVVSRMLTDTSVNNFLAAEANKPQTVNFAEVIGSMYRAGDFDLILTPTEVKGIKACAYADDYVSIFKLNLSLKNEEQNKTVVLQNDASLPPSRGCPIHYAIQYVYLYEDKIAVFLNKYEVGFEGPDMRYMVVTGRYK